jgi:hypothetical protein
LCAQHEHDLEVKVLWGTWSWGPRANRKATDREVRAERSGERSRESTNRNRIPGVTVGANGQETAKPPRPKGDGVNLAIARRKSWLLPGEVSPYA